MKCPGAIPVLLLALATTASARIGESLEQCGERYGPLVEKRRAELPESDPEAGVFSRNGITIIVEFRKGTAWRILFRKPKLTAPEVEALLEANAGTGAWSSPLTYGDREYRLAADKSRVAVATLGPNRAMTQLEIMLREYGGRLRAQTLARLRQAGSAGEARKKANPLPGF